MLLDSLSKIREIKDDYTRSSLITAVDEELRFRLKCYIYLDDTRVNDIPEGIDCMFRCGNILIGVDSSNMIFYTNVADKVLGAVSQDGTDEVDYDLTVDDLAKTMKRKNIRFKSKDDLVSEFNSLCSRLGVSVDSEDYNTLVTLLAFTVGTGKYTHLLFVKGPFAGDYSTYNGIGYKYDAYGDTIFVVDKELPKGNTGLSLTDVDNLYTNVNLGSIEDVLIANRFLESKCGVFNIRNN